MAKRPRRFFLRAAKTPGNSTCSQSSHGSAANKLQYSLANPASDAEGNVLKNYAVTNNLHEKGIGKTYRGLRLSFVAFHLAFQSRHLENNTNPTTFMSLVTTTTTVEKKAKYKEGINTP